MFFYYERRRDWIVNGGVEEGWDTYLKQLENLGVFDVVAAWQAAYDRYEAALQ